MPDQRLKKARESLPGGYQFGDARDRDRERDELRERWVARLLVEGAAHVMVGEQKLRDHLRCR